MTVIERDTMDAIIDMARSLEKLSKSIDKQNQLLEELLAKKLAEK